MPIKIASNGDSGIRKRKVEYELSLRKNAEHNKRDSFRYIQNKMKGMCIPDAQLR